MRDKRRDQGFVVPKNRLSSLLWYTISSTVTNETRWQYTQGRLHGVDRVVDKSTPLLPEGVRENADPVSFLRVSTE